MNQAQIAQRGPYAVDVQAGRKYFWCALTPLSYAAERDRTLYFCGCKRTDGPPLCDGTHNTL